MLLKSKTEYNNINDGSLHRKIAERGIFSCSIQDTGTTITVDNKEEDV